MIELAVPVACCHQISGSWTKTQVTSSGLLRSICSTSGLPLILNSWFLCTQYIQAALQLPWIHFILFFFIYFNFFVHINKQSGSGLSSRSKNILRKLGDFFSSPHCSFTTECWGGVWGMWASCVWRVNLESSAHHLLTQTSLHWQVILGWSRVKA